MTATRNSPVRAVLGITLTAAALAASPLWGQSPAVSFERDVMAVLSRSGCNQGACHANQNGKGGFKLSLRGENPDFDFAALVRQFDQRRVNLEQPEQSLLLAKPAGGAPHQGGVRFRQDSFEYALLRDWIAAGAPRRTSGDDSPVVRLEVEPREAILVEPQDSLTLKAIAHFADGTQRDVTELAVYDLTDDVVTTPAAGAIRRAKLGFSTVIVRYLQQQAPVRISFIPDRPRHSWTGPPPENPIDALVFAEQSKYGIVPSDLCDDATFLRRLTLDLLGVLPTPEEVRAFLADALPDKRERAADKMLARPEFAEQWALKWSDLLRNEEKVLDAKGVDGLFDWLRDGFAHDKPISTLARELVASQGSTYENPPANFYRANRDPFARAETAARLFLGVRLQCAKCHNHPFDRWTQDDYYDWSGVFARVDYKIVDNKRKDKLDKHEFDGEQIVLWTKEGEVDNPRTGRKAKPRLLGAEKALAGDKVRLEAAADWLSGGENRDFSRAQANFIWYHLLGRGLVEPIDDFRATNPPTIPALLEHLAGLLTRRNYELRSLVREIVVSRTYQTVVAPNPTNEGDDRFYSRTLPRRLSAEKLLDAQCQAALAAVEFNGYPSGTRAGLVKGVQRVRPRDESPSAGDRFLRTFGKPDRLLACECERSNETTLKQALTLIGDAGLQKLLSQPHNRLHQLRESGQPPAAMVEELYLAALSRLPSPDESKQAALWLTAEPDQLAGLQDLLWALLNSKEFLFRH